MVLLISILVQRCMYYIMNNILITGGSHAEIPLIDAIHELGFNVISTGLNSDGLGHVKADLYIPGDFSDKDFVTRVAKDYQVSGIVSGCNDFAYLSTAYACEKLRLHGHDNIINSKIIHNKKNFRNMLYEINLPVPKYFECRNKNDLDLIRNSFMLPVIVKPVDLTGGKGVRICNSWEEVEKAYDNAIKVTRESYILIEEFIEGENHGFSGLIKNQHVVFSFFDNEEYYINKYLVSGAYAPSDLTDIEKSDIIEQINCIAKKLNLCDGLFHCQCIVTRDRICYLIDPCRRSPGDLYINLVKYATGFDYPMAIVKNELGMDIIDELNYSPANRCISRECIMTDKSGIIQSININDEYKNRIIDKMIWAKAGDKIEDYYKYKAGIVFFEYSDKESLKEKMKTIHDNMLIEVY